MWSLSLLPSWSKMSLDGTFAPWRTAVKELFTLKLVSCVPGIKRPWRVKIRPTTDIFGADVLIVHQVVSRVYDVRCVVLYNVCVVLLPVAEKLCCSLFCVFWLFHRVSSFERVWAKNLSVRQRTYARYYRLKIIILVSYILPAVKYHHVRKNVNTVMILTRLYIYSIPFIIFTLLFTVLV